MSQDYAKTGKVVTPTTSTDHAIVRFDGAGGYTVQDSGVTIADSNIMTTPAQINSTLATGTAPLAVLSTTKVTSLNADQVDGADLDITTTLGTSDVKVPSQNAVKTYADTKIPKTTNITALNEAGIADGEIAVFNLTNKDIRTSDKIFSIDGTLAGNADTNVPTEKAVKTYADTKIPKVTLTDHAIPRASGTDGTLQNSGVTIDDSNNIVATGTGQLDIEAVTTSTTQSVLMTKQCGDGTTSIEYAYDRYISSETVPQTWAAGMYGNKSYTLKNATANTSPLIVDTSGNIIVAGNIYTADWTDYSGTSTIVGFGAYTVKIFNYKKLGNLCYVHIVFDSGGTAGSGTAVTFTLPYALATQTGDDFYLPAHAYDNSAWAWGAIRMATGSTTVNAYTTAGGVGWTNSTRRLLEVNFFYRTAT